MLYLISNTERTRLKLGFSRNPEQRLKALQTGHPDKIELLATHPGSIADERRFHAWLSPSRSSGEWFRWTPKIDEILAKWN
jgi:Meiotically up-regulated gene 113